MDVMASPAFDVETESAFSLRAIRENSPDGRVQLTRQLTVVGVASAYSPTRAPVALE
jgi:hypothetical protein